MDTVCVLCETETGLLQFTLTNKTLYFVHHLDDGGFTSTR